MILGRKVTFLFILEDIWGKMAVDGMLFFR